VLGSGDVGKTLAAGLKRHGYDVRIATRTPGKLDEFSKTSGVPAVTFPEAAVWAEVLVLAVKGAAATDAIREARPDALGGKIVIDTTNPISPVPAEDGVLHYFTTPNSSLLEQLQSTFPEIKFVKAFNSVGHRSMVNPSFSGGKPTMFYCGNDAGAKRMAAEIIEKFGWEPADMGTAKAARAIEPLCQLWCIPGLLQNSWGHAFKMFWQ